ncbi:pyrimidine dimer DNA glycosylase/endonuclease V [Clostridioides difficile]|uniref:pyrimidine dimer DNA glycosylase/endonuclease V n=1 Tax=Clostridioides difficile TaxID=1496 RepID=UPI001034CB6F|nr:pyrimidine dimer DNA glycosylase/endonuclease V [Clostridioides difficile]
MRLWHKDLIDVLPKNQLVSQWRELLAIKGSIDKKGTPNHLLVNKVLNYSIDEFKFYTKIVHDEMLKRNYKPNELKYTSILKWKNRNFANDISNEHSLNLENLYDDWHNKMYLKQCLYNLEEKATCGGIPINEWNIFLCKYIKDYELWSGNIMF